MANKYVVRVDVSYVSMGFEFDTVAGACNFMDTFLDHVKVEGEKEVEVWMERQKGDK